MLISENQSQIKSRNETLRSLTNSIVASQKSIRGAASVDSVIFDDRINSYAQIYRKYKSLNDEHSTALFSIFKENNYKFPPIANLSSK